MLTIWKYQQQTGIKLSEFDTLFPEEKEIAKGNLGKFDEDVSILFKLIWAGLYDEEDLATPEQVGRIIDFDNVAELAKAVLTFAVASMPEVLEKKVERVTSKKSEKNGPGKAPSSTPAESE